MSKKSNQVTVLRSRGSLQVVNDTKLVLNEHEWPPSFRVNLESFRTLRRPLFPKPVSWLGLFLLLLSTRRLYIWNTYQYILWESLHIHRFIDIHLHFLIKIQTLCVFLSYEHVGEVVVEVEKHKSCQCGCKIKEEVNISCIFPFSILQNVVVCLYLYTCVIT